MIDRINNNVFSSQLRNTTMTDQLKEIELTINSDIEKETSSDQHLNKKQVEEIVQGINDFLSPTHTSLKFEFHEKLNEYYVTIVDDQTRQIVKEIPSKKLLDFYAAMTDFIGLMVDKKI